MILSHRHKFIYLHCRKTAGSSITVSLARHLGDSDILVGSIVDAAAHGIKPTREIIHDSIRRPSLFASKYLIRKFSFAEYVNVWVKREYLAKLGANPAHATAQQIKLAFPSEWSSYHTFCAIRNPWDKTVSDYFWRTKGRPSSPTFPEYVIALNQGDNLGGIVPHLHSNWEIYTINDKVAVDKVLRYENLIDELSDYMKSIGLPWDGWMPKSKEKYKTRAKRPSDYRTMYSDDDAETIRQLYSEEIQLGDYSF